MKYGKIFAICVSVCVSVIVMVEVAVAGYVHFNGKTIFTTQATAATIWRRNNRNGDIFLLPEREVQIFENTTHRITNGVEVLDFGWWTIDADGDYRLMRLGLDHYTRRNLRGRILDCEFEMNSSGDVIPKEWKRSQ